MAWIKLTLPIQIQYIHPSNVPSKLRGARPRSCPRIPAQYFRSAAHCSFKMLCSFLFFLIFHADIFLGAHMAFYSAQLSKLLEGTLPIHMHIQYIPIQYLTHTVPSFHEIVSIVFDRKHNMLTSVLIMIFAIYISSAAVESQIIWEQCLI